MINYFTYDFRVSDKIEKYLQDSLANGESLFDITDLETVTTTTVSPSGANVSSLGILGTPVKTVDDLLRPGKIYARGPSSAKAKYSNRFRNKGIHTPLLILFHSI
jgi:hypothetical protein